MINNQSHLREHRTKPFENAPGAWPIEEEQECQQTKVLTLPVGTAPRREAEEAGNLANKRMSIRKERGLFEKLKGSGIWWIRYADANGKERREKAGTRGMAIRLYQKRKTEALQGKKLPETIRRKQVLVSDLLELAADHRHEDV